MQGETLIHLLLNRQELVCQEVARILITKYPGLAKDIYLGEDLFGGLHVKRRNRGWECVFEVVQHIGELPTIFMD